MADSLIDYRTARAIADAHGTPVYVYDERVFRKQAKAMLDFPAPFGLTVRYAIKALSTRAVLRLFEEEGLHFDASSGCEAERLLIAGIQPHKISISTQELPPNFADLIHRGISINACSLDQLEKIGRAFPGSKVGLRFNPGLGSGGTNRTNVGGPASSFGIWHEKISSVKAAISRYRLTPHRIHTHIGSGSDPAVWTRAAGLSLEIVEAFESVTHFNLGGGYKVARMPNEKGTDLQTIGAPVAGLLAAFADRTGRRLHLELEPGTFLTANAGALLSTVQDQTDTGPDGYRFLKLDCGMTDILRPSLYGAQHPIHILQPTPSGAVDDYIVVGHCCESGDILTPAPADPEALAPRALATAAIGDFALIGGAGAYCSAMAAKNYNSFPELPEVLLREDRSFKLIRRRQTLLQVIENEMD